jgi:hypothetical protein
MFVVSQSAATVMSRPAATFQEFMGHADSETRQIYAHYAPSEHEIQVVNEVFAAQTSREDGSAPSAAKTLDACSLTLPAQPKERDDGPRR